jgi:AmmeMemoRadiSam system protein B
MVRQPYVAGQFYEASAPLLRQQVERYSVKGLSKKGAIAVIAPHAGLIYSGSVAGAVYSSIVPPDTFILLGPNHTGLGATVAVYPDGYWQTPLGALKVNGELSESIMLKCNLCNSDQIAHNYEHSLEVHLPFIASMENVPYIVPIAIMKASLSECAEIGHALAEAIRGYGKKVTISASTDMSHYVSDTMARRLDAMAIEKMLQLDPSGLYEVVAKNRISMCGVLPVTVALYAANALGAKEATLIKYTTSAEVSGDYNHVVGYAGIIIT